MSRLQCVSVFILTLSAIILVTACEDESRYDNGAASVASNSAMVMTTDYTTGALSFVNTATLMVKPAVEVVHSDSVCRYDDTFKKMFLVSRLGSDAVTVIGLASGMHVIRQYSVESGTNAQDIAVINTSRALIPRLASPVLLVVHPTTGAVVQRIDISAYADADGLPEAAQAFHRNGKVYVTLQRIDTAWQPTDYSSMLVLNGATGSITKEIRLTGKNPTGKLRFSTVVNGFVLNETGAYGVTDGGIETVNEDGMVSGLLITEEALGGDVLDAVIATDNKGFAIISVPGEGGSQTQLVVFNYKTGVKGATLIASGGFDLGAMELRENGTLWVADRTPTRPGVRIFDVTNNAELTASPLDVGLPPSSICFGD